MPELPEVETIARGLAVRVAGDVIESVWLGSKPEPLKSPATQIEETLRSAKILNVRVLRMESSYVVRYLLPRRSVETFYLLFPDPWPKRRHWRRRIVTLDLLKAISQALIQGGILIIATDNLNYFEKIKEIARANLDFAIVDPASVDLPLSRFARIFQQQGAAIHWLELRKDSPVR